MLRILSNSQRLLLDGPRRGLLFIVASLERLAPFQRLAVFWIAGGVTLSVVTLVCFRLGSTFATSAFAYLIVIVAFSWLGNSISSVIFSVMAAGCLDFFFTQPLYSFRVDEVQNVAALAAFLVIALAVSRLGGRVQELEKAQRDHAVLEQSERRYRDMFRSMPIGLVQIDATAVEALFKDVRAQGVTDLPRFLEENPEFVRRVTDATMLETANDEAIRMLGAKSAAEMIGPITRYWEASFDTVRRSFEARFRGGEFFQTETKMSTVDGRVIDVIFVAVRIAAAPGRALCGFIDISARVRAQEMLNRVQADFAHAARVSMLGELTASIAHEVNQPLTAIGVNARTSLRWLNRAEPDVAQARALAEHIVADVRRAADIVARIRSMAAGQAPVYAPLLVDDVVREALLFLRHEAQARSATVIHDPAPGAPQVLGDRTQLQQVIVNLLVNSMQAMAHAESPRRRITVRTVADPATVRCSVEDSGPGIKPEDLSRLFQSFFTTKQEGMGMGLPICRSIIEAHGGSIDADNQGPDGGARFSVTLPAAPCAEPK